MPPLPPDELDARLRAFLCEDVGSADVTTDADGMHFGWRNGNGSVCDPESATINSTIEVAFAESPIPEPATIFIFTATLLGFSTVRRHLPSMRP